MGTTGMAGRRAILLAAPVLLAGCGGPRVQEARRYRGPPLPRPQRIYVVQLGVLPEDVKLDQGVSDRLLRTLSAERPQQAQLAAGRQAAGTVAEETAARLRGYGLPAERVAAVPPPQPGPAVLVEGHVVAVDQGNRTRRMVLGFGQGESSVAVEIQVYWRDGAAPPRLIDSFEVTATSPLRPGAIGPLGVGAAAGRIVESAAAAGLVQAVTEARSTDTGTEGRQVGDALAHRLGLLFAELGWVSRGAIT